MKLRTGIVVLVAALLIIAGCGKDNGTDPETSLKISGTVTFTGEWPQDAADVRVVAGMDFPIQNFDDLVMSDAIASEGSVSFSLEVESGTYDFVGVIWKPANGEWNLAGICGIYTMDSEFGAPAGVTVDSDNPTAEGIDISVNRSRAKSAQNAEIIGNINLQGAWPDGYVSAVVVSSAKDLIAEDFDLLDLNMGTAVDQSETSKAYVVPSPPGTIKSIGILFLNAEGIIATDALYFSQNNGGLIIEDVEVATNASVVGPDFNMTLGSVTSAIQGTVNFIGDWPETAEEVRLITATVYPPAIEELIIGEEIQPDVDTHKYTFYLPPDTYKLVGVAWRAEGTNWDVMSICGAYFVGEDSLAPGEIEIPSDDTIIKDINIVVDRSKARKATETYIQGNVAFNGDWPEGITEARVIATTRFQIFPTVIPTMLDLAFGASIPAGTTSFNYNLKAFPGTFAAIGVIFLKADEQLNINDILYSLDVGGLSLDPFAVEENTVATGPDFNVQF